MVEREILWGNLCIWFSLIKETQEKKEVRTGGILGKILIIVIFERKQSIKISIDFTIFSIPNFMICYLQAARIHFQLSSLSFL